MLVHLDGGKVEVAAGTRLADLVRDHDPSCVVAVIRPAERESAETGHLRVKTTAGEVVLEIAGPLAGILESPGIIQDVALHWDDRYTAAFGPFETGIHPAKRPQLYERGDVILGCGGYDPARSYLIFSKMRHSADHGAPEGRGVIASVVSGRAILDRWTTGDRILGIERVVSWADTSRSYTTTDLSVTVDDGMQVVTYAEIMAQGVTPDSITTATARSVEHLLLSLKDGTFHVGRAASTFIRDDRRAGDPVPAEYTKPRREGTVTVRTDGKAAGSIYLYRADVPSSTVHTIAGQVVHGIELVRLAKAGEIFTVKVTPTRFDLLGIPLADAAKIAETRKIRFEADTPQPTNDRVVVRQEPETTLDVLKRGSVTVQSTPLAKVIDIRLDDKHAPDSCALFRRVTGLSEHSTGVLPFFFTFEDVYLFRPDIPAGTKITPENTPTGEVPAAALGITNDARKGVGLVGVRLSPNPEFGPTSEPFEGSNIIGTVLSTEKLKGIREKETIYIREVRT